MNIYQKLIEVRKEVPYLSKENSGYQFKYVSSSQVLAGLKKKMDELGLLLIPRVTGHNVTTDIFDKVANGQSKRTVDYFTEIDVEFTWVNAEDPTETIVCPWYGQGCDTAGEKGVGKALTYAEKYFMLKFFNIPTDKDDPDSFQQRQEGKDKPNGDRPPQQANRQNQQANRQQSTNNPQNPQNNPQGGSPPKPEVSEAQIKRMYTIASKKGVSNEEIKQVIVNEFHKNSSKELTKKEYDQIVADLEKKPDLPF